MDERNGQVLAVGDEAYTMLGKTASDIRVVRPLEDGVLSDYEAVSYTHLDAAGDAQPPEETDDLLMRAVGFIQRDNLPHRR